MVFSYQKLLILAYYWSIDPPQMAFFTLAIVDEMMQLALTGPGMIQDTPRTFFHQLNWLQVDLRNDIRKKPVFSYVFHTFPIAKRPKTHRLFSIFVCNDFS